MELRIKQLCKEKGLKMEELAKEVGITRTSLSLIQNGKMNTTMENYNKIAEKLGVSFVELFTESKQQFCCPHCGKKITIGKGE